MNSRIYFAAPLHGTSDQCRNTMIVRQLRNEGFDVFLPQENGIWEQMIEKCMQQNDITRADAIKHVKSQLFTENVTSIKHCDVVVAAFGERKPSEGGIWEMGYAYGIGKKVFLLNDHEWDFNLMPCFGSTMCINIEDLIQCLHAYAMSTKDKMIGDFV